MFDFLIYIILFVFGIAFGSFASVVVDRMFRDEGFFSGRSYCEKCKHILSTIDLIPVFSFILQKGKCRYCKFKIPPSLFLAELIFGFLFVLIPFKFGLIPVSILNLTLSGLFWNVWLVMLVFVIALIFLSDIKYMVISDRYFYVLFFVYLLGVIFYYYFPYPNSYLMLFFTDYKDHLWGGLSMAAFFGVLVVVSKERVMGEGDIYLAGILGLMLGLKLAFMMWFLAFLIGAVVGVLLILSRIRKLKGAVPFGPFLIIGFWLALFYGDELLYWYLSMFLI